MRRRYLRVPLVRRKLRCPVDLRVLRPSPAHDALMCPARRCGYAVGMLDLVLHPERVIGTTDEMRALGVKFREAIN